MKKRVLAVIMMAVMAMASVMGVSAAGSVVATPSVTTPQKPATENQNKGYDNRHCAYVNRLYNDVFKGCLCAVYHSWLCVDFPYCLFLFWCENIQNQRKYGKLKMVAMATA